MSPIYTCEICQNKDSAELPCPQCGRYACERCWLGSLCVVCAAKSPAHTLFLDENGMAYISSLRRLTNAVVTILAILVPWLAVALGIWMWLSPRFLFRSHDHWKRWRRLSPRLFISGLIGFALWAAIILLTREIPALRPYRLF